MLQDILSFGLKLYEDSSTYGIPQPPKLNFNPIVMKNLGLIGGVEEGEVILGNGFKQGPSDLAMTRTFAWLLTGALGIVTISLGFGSNGQRDQQALVACAGIATILSGIVSSYFSFVKKDLNSADERRDLVEQISKKNFHEIAELHSSNDVHCFCLLNNDLQLMNRTHLYKKYEQLYEQFLRAQQHRDECLQSVDNLYSGNGGYLEKQLTTIETDKDAEGEEHTWTYYPNTKPSKEFSFFDNTRSSAAQTRLTEWVDWRENEKEEINAIYSNHLRTLDMDFAEQLTELQAH